MIRLVEICFFKIIRNKFLIIVYVFCYLSNMTNKIKMVQIKLIKNRIVVFHLENK